MFGALQQVAIRGLNHLLQSESWAQERLRQHAGAKLLVEAGGLNIPLTIDERGLFQAGDESTSADVVVSLPADSVIGALLDRGNAFAALKLAGSAEVAECLAFVFRNLKWDVEADLAAIVGDIPARRLAMIGNTALTSVQNGMLRVTENLGEYAVQDSGLLVTEAELVAFGQGIDGLRDDLTRLEKRISRL